MVVRQAALQAAQLCGCAEAARGCTHLHARRIPTSRTRPWALQRGRRTWTWTPWPWWGQAHEAGANVEGKHMKQVQMVKASTRSRCWWWGQVYEAGADAVAVCTVLVQMVRPFAWCWCSWWGRLHGAGAVGEGMVKFSTPACLSYVVQSCHGNDNSVKFTAAGATSLHEQGGILELVHACVW